MFNKCIRGIKSADGYEYLCHTCHQTIKKGIVPKLSISNKLQFPQKPLILFLNNLEEKLVSPIIMFYQLRELPFGNQ